MRSIIGSLRHLRAPRRLLGWLPVDGGATAWPIDRRARLGYDVLCGWLYSLIDLQD